MGSDNLLDGPDLRASEIATMGQSKWIQPDLRHTILARYVYVGRFAAITRIEEKPI
jgi:hypothetical protein